MTTNPDGGIRGSDAPPDPREVVVHPQVIPSTQDGVRDRVATLSDQERKVLHECLLALAAGHAPRVPELAARAGLTIDEVRAALQPLEARDRVALAGEEVRVAYPFSADAVPHAILSSRGVARTCCAIDALGVGAMLGEAIQIRSRCSHCGQPIQLRGQERFDGSPEAPVVFVPLMGRTEGKAIDVCCPSINFYCSPEHAKADIGDASGRGRILSLKEATRLGVTLFGGLLRTLE